MPYKSKKQRAYLHIHEPALAARWDAEFPNQVVKKKKTKKKGKKKHS